MYSCINGHTSCNSHVIVIANQWLDWTTGLQGHTELLSKGAKFIGEVEYMADKGVQGFSGYGTQRIGGVHPHRHTAKHPNLHT